MIKLILMPLLSSCISTYAQEKKSIYNDQQFIDFHENSLISLEATYMHH